MKTHKISALTGLSLTPIFALLAACACAVPCLGAAPTPVAGKPVSAYTEEVNSPRQRIFFDFDWKFTKGDATGAEQLQYNDSQWQTVQLPHDWSISEPFDPKLAFGKNSGFLPIGIGWYRKRFALPAGLKGEQVTIEFEGAYRDVTVWLNGKCLGNQKNGYTTFFYDLTPHLLQNGTNQLAVRCDNSVGWSSRWYTGSGIYRHVWLHGTRELHVPMWGTYVTTPEVSEKQATVKIKTSVKNTAEKQQQAAITTLIMDGSGRVVAQQVATQSIPAGQAIDVSQDFTVPQPALWSPEAPNLYSAVTRIEAGGGLQDTYKTIFGIRSIEFSPTQGLLVNGKKTLIKGVNLHHDLGALGAAAFDRAIERRLQALKRMGVNGIRTSHNPHAPKLLELCDKMGFLVYNEAFDKWSDQYYRNKGKWDEELWGKDLELFLQRDRNHPSVFIWSVGNELQQQGVEKPGAEAGGWGVPELKQLVEFVHQHEPSRKVTCGLYPSRAGNLMKKDVDKETWDKSEPPPMIFHMDVVSYNYTFEFFAKDHARWPNLTFIGSEAATDGGANQWLSWDKAYVVGIFYWGGTDYIGEAADWPNKGWFRGLLDMTDELKPIAYHVKSVFSSEPMVHIAVKEPEQKAGVVWNDVQFNWRGLASHWNWAGQDKVHLTTYTNAKTVELVLNGKSLGEKPLDERKMLIEWDVPYTAGTLRAIAKTDGKVVAEDTLKTAGKPVKLVLEADHNQVQADGQDLAFIKVRVVDAAGVQVPEGSPLIQFEVTGNGTNAGVDNGSMYSDESWQGNTRSARLGRAQLIVRSTRTPGAITVKASAEGLPPAQLTIQSRSGVSGAQSVVIK